MRLSVFQVYLPSKTGPSLTGSNLANQQVI